MGNTKQIEPRCKTYFRYKTKFESTLVGFRRLTITSKLFAYATNPYSYDCQKYR